MSVLENGQTVPICPASLAHHSFSLTVHVHLDLVVVKEADVDPLVLAGGDLLVVDDVVAGGAVAALVELELVPAQACNGKGRYYASNKGEIARRVIHE